MKNLFWNFLLILFVFQSCEKDTIESGADLVDDKIKGYKTYIGVTAYSINTNDTIRADRNVLDSSAIGVYQNSVFGKIKSGLISQVRLNTETFPQNVKKVDSVVLCLFPSYDNKYSSTKKNIGGDTIQEIRRYPLKSFVGNKQKFKLQVQEVNTFLGTTEYTYYSDALIDVGQTIGNVEISDSIIQIITTLKEALVSSTDPSFRISLDPQFFKEKFFDNASTPELSDNSRFIQYFKGISIQPADNSTFIFTHDLNRMNLKVYYTSEDGTGKEYDFVVGSSLNSSNRAYYNVVVGNYSMSRGEASSDLLSKLQNPDKEKGENLIYMQGMGGPLAHIKINDAEMQAIKDSIKQKGWMLTSAKLKFYLANDQLLKPYKLYAYNGTQNILLKELTHYIEDNGLLIAPENFQAFNPPYNNKGYYEINITEDIIQRTRDEIPNDDIIVGIGDFINKNFSGLYSYSLTNVSRAYKPQGVVFYGNNVTEDLLDKQLKVEIIYSK